jgi:hypothetical protein
MSDATRTHDTTPEAKPEDERRSLRAAERAVRAAAAVQASYVRGLRAQLCTG